MKGERYTAEDKIRILCVSDRGKNAAEVCRAHNISEVSFHRWKRQSGQIDLSEARKPNHFRQHSKVGYQSLAHFAAQNLLPPRSKLGKATQSNYIPHASD